MPPDPSAGPRPRFPERTAGPVVVHSARKSTSAGVSFGPRTWNESMTGQVLHVQHRPPVVHLEVDRALADVERPEQPRRQHAAVEIVHLRPRTGVEEVNSDEGERALARTPRRRIGPRRRECPSRGWRSCRRFRARCRRGTRRARALEVRGRDRLDVESSEHPACEGKRDRGITRNEDVEDADGGPTSKAPPGMGFGAGNTALVMAREDAAEVDEGHTSFVSPAPATVPAAPSTNLRRFKAAPSGLAPLLST